MRRRPAVLLMVLMLGSLAASCWAQEAEASVVLRYAPKAGEHTEGVISGKLTNLTMSGAPVELSAAAIGTVQQDVLRVDEASGEFDARITVSIDKAEFAGQERELPDPKPVEVTVSPLGEIVKQPQVQGSEPQGQGRAGALVTEGVPLDVVAGMAAWVQLPEHPVAVGDTWTTEDEQEFPVVGRCTVTTVTRLDRVEGRRAFLISDATLTLPPSEIDNPWFEGKIKIESGTLKAEEVERELDLDRGVVVSARGRLRAELQVDIGAGMPWPVGATIEFELEPLDNAGTPEAEVESALEPGRSAGRGAVVGDGQTPVHGVQVGPVSVAAAFDSGAMTVRSKLDMSRLPLPPALRAYQPLLSLFQVGTHLELGVAGPQAGQLGVGIQGQMGPYSLNHDVRLDLRLSLARLLEFGRCLIPQVRP